MDSTCAIVCPWPPSLGVGGAVGWVWVVLESNGTEAATKGPVPQDQNLLVITFSVLFTL